MNNSIREFKEDLLAKLKAKKSELEGTRATLVAVKLANKKTKNEQTFKDLDENLAKYVAEKQAKFNEEVANMKSKIAQKKADLENSVNAEAKAEADAELSAQFAEFDKEINALEKELASAN